MIKKTFNIRKEAFKLSISIKSEREIALMRESNRLLAIMHLELEKMVTPGRSTWDIDMEARRYAKDCGCGLSFLNYEGYPAALCISVNEEVVHGIPRKDKILQEGDIVSIDAGLIYKGYHSDAARTYGVGTISPEKQKLIDET